MKYIDLFAGMGGFRTAFDRQGFECVFSSEIDKYAAKAYEILYGDKPSGDITKIDEKEIPDHDILCGGFPCPEFSKAKRGKGFDTDKLFFEIIRIAESKRPCLLVIENVDNLLKKDGGRIFARILQELDEIGYDAEWECIDSGGFLPQHRERVFIVGHLRDESFRKILPVGRKVSNRLIQVGRWELKSQDSIKRIYSVHGMSPTLTTMQGGHRQPKVLTKDGPRKLTPLECFRLQGFPDEYHAKLREHGFSDSQLYKLAGNAVTVDVVEEIASKIRRLYVENCRS